jgi:antitoxin (DNA-binding transcriptional repressor) of toxin-antitoxin stability system
MSKPEGERRVGWDELRSSGVGIIDKATATQDIVILTRRDAEIAVIVPIARYSRLVALARKGVAK